MVASPVVESQHLATLMLDEDGPSSKVPLGASISMFSASSLPLEESETEASSAAAGGAAAEAVEEKDEFDVVLEAAGDQKIQVIKEVRAITNLGLGEAKALVDAAPSIILEGAKKDAAEEAKAKLEAAGGKVTLK